MLSEEFLDIILIHQEGRSLIGGLALIAGDRSSVSVLVDCRYLRLACHGRVVVLLFLKLGQSVLRAHDELRGQRR